MKIETFSFLTGRRWSVPRFPDLDSESTLVLAFGCPEDETCATSLEELSAAYPRAHFHGCSTAGEILGKSIHDRSVAVAVCRFDKTHLRSMALPIRSSADSNEAGRLIAHNLDAPGLRGVLVISDGLSVNGSEFVQGLNATLPEGAVVTGCLAGGGDRFKRTWVLNGRNRESGWISQSASTATAWTSATAPKEVGTSSDPSASLPLKAELSVSCGPTSIAWSMGPGRPHAWQEGKPPQTFCPSPLAASGADWSEGHCELYNQTMTLTTIKED